MKQGLIPFPDDDTKLFHVPAKVVQELPFLKAAQAARHILESNDNAHAVVKQAIAQREYKKYGERRRARFCFVVFSFVLFTLILVDFISSLLNLLEVISWRFLLTLLAIFRYENLRAMPRRITCCPASRANRRPAWSLRRDSSSVR
jgi:hypothetical protein